MRNLHRSLHLCCPHSPKSAFSKGPKNISRSCSDKVVKQTTVTSVQFVSSSTCLYVLIPSSYLVAFGWMIFVILSNKVS